jgi:hypothetical protein
MSWMSSDDYFENINRVAWGTNPTTPPYYLYYSMAFNGTDVTEAISSKLKTTSLQDSYYMSDVAEPNPVTQIKIQHAYDDDDQVPRAGVIGILGIKTYRGMEVEIILDGKIRKAVLGSDFYRDDAFAYGVGTKKDTVNMYFKYENTDGVGYGTIEIKLTNGKYAVGSNTHANQAPVGAHEVGRLWFGNYIPIGVDAGVNTQHKTNTVTLRTIGGSIIKNVKSVWKVVKFKMSGANLTNPQAHGVSTALNSRQDKFRAQEMSTWQAECIVCYSSNDFSGLTISETTPDALLEIEWGNPNDCIYGNLKSTGMTQITAEKYTTDWTIEEYL